MSTLLRSQQLAAAVLLFDRLTPTNRSGILQDLWFCIPPVERDDPALMPARQFAAAKVQAAWWGVRGAK